MIKSLLFLDISGGELLVIVFFILIFFGSKSIPDIARTLGRTVRQFKDATSEIQRDIENSTRSIKQEIDTEKRKLTENLRIDQMLEDDDKPEKPQH